MASLAKLLLLDAGGAAARRRVLLLDLRDEQSFAACHVDGGGPPCSALRANLAAQPSRATRGPACCLSHEAPCPPDAGARGARQPPATRRGGCRTRATPSRRSCSRTRTRPAASLRSTAWTSRQARSASGRLRPGCRASWGRAVLLLGKRTRDRLSCKPQEALGAMHHVQLAPAPAMCGQSIAALW